MSEPTLVHDMLRRSAEARGDAPFLLLPGRTVGYAETERLANQLARVLRDSGITRGDRVAVLARNSLEYVAGYYAALKAGTIAVPVNTAIGGPGLRYLLENCSVRAMITQPEFAPLVREALVPGPSSSEPAPPGRAQPGRLSPGPGSSAPRSSEPELRSSRPASDSSGPASPKIPRPVFASASTPEPAGPGLVSPGSLELVLSEQPDAFSGLGGSVRVRSLLTGLEGVPGDPLSGEVVRPDDPASIIYTSGSTGRPRGAVLTHGNLVANTRSIVRYLALSPEDRMMVILPFYYVYGKSLLNTHAWVGGSLIVGTDLFFPNDAVKRMTDDGATGLAGVPSSFAVLLMRSRFARAVPPTLRYVTQAGGAMAPEMIQKVMDALPDVRVYIMYGATEASARLTYLDPVALPRKIGSIGKAIPDVTVRVLRADGAETDPGEPGELVAQGPNIMRGYWEDPDETALVLGAGGLRTGDLAYRDEEGYLFIVGRKKEMIKCGSHRISPKEIEDVFMEHPAVFEVAVLGVPDELLGEAIRAYVALRPGSVSTPEDLLRFAAERLPEYKVPGTLEILPELPKNESGKIQKRRLAEAR